VGAQSQSDYQQHHERTGGLRKLSHGEVTTWSLSRRLPYPGSGLAGLSGSETEAQRRWRELAGAKIEANNRISLAIAASIPKAVGFYDLIYHPEETVFLRHGRLSGHPTMNGKAMIVNQAVIAFCKCICSAELQTRGMDAAQTQRQILKLCTGLESSAQL
jgi:hypothetical protein